MVVGTGQELPGAPGGKPPKLVYSLPSGPQYETKFAPAGPTTASMTGFVQLDGNTIAVAVLPTTTEICLIASRRLNFLSMPSPLPTFLAHFNRTIKKGNRHAQLFLLGQPGGLEFSLSYMD